jgi:YD repeat-containing protein
MDALDTMDAPSPYCKTERVQAGLPTNTAAHNKPPPRRTGVTINDSTTTGQSAFAWLAPGSAIGTTNYVVNDLNQYTTAGNASPSYDPRGNMTSDGRNTMTYDYRNRLISAVNGDYSTTYAYDVFDRRVSKLAAATGRTKSFYAREAILEHRRS